MMNFGFDSFKNCLIILVIICFSNCSVFNKHHSTYFDRNLAQSKQVSLINLKSETLNRLEKVDEFKAMKEIAEELGIEKVYFFGGSASAWIHYVYWDLEREVGIGNYHEQRFDYDYTSIFRSNQDMDVVVDIDPSDVNKVSEFEKRLSEKFPHFQGNKSAWEVRPLRFEYGTKDSLLDNPDFLNQNTDSHSTGLIEVTGNDDFGIRDVRDWENRENNFLKDAHRKHNTYYYDNRLHSTTKRFKEGLNPEIMSAIRYLIKAVQYELEIDEDADKYLRKVLSEFDPEKDLTQGYTKGWLENNGKKLYQNAVDLEYAYNLLRRYGVQDLLKKVGGNIDDQESLAWWMNKKPLLSSPLGDPNKGKSAKELGIDTVAHETNSFAAYESITKSHSGEANVFISRKEAAGEAAVHGDGFYTAIGREGMRGTGMTIRFKLHPEAIEGVDFIKNGEMIIVQNKRAIEVINESLNLSLVEYFENLINGEILFDASDKAVKEKVKRKLLKSATSISKEDEEKIYKLVLSHIEKYKNSIFDEALIEWFDLNISRKYPGLVEKLIEKGNIDTSIAGYVLSKEYWKHYPEWIEKIIERGNADQQIAKYVLSKEHWKNHPEWVENLIEKGNAEWQIAQHVLSKEHWKDYPKLVEKLIEKGTVDREIAEYVLSEEHWKDHPKLVEKLIGKGSVDKYIAVYVLSQEHWRNHPEWVEKFIEKGNVNEHIAESVLSQEHWRDHPELVDKLIEKGNVDIYIAYSVLSKEHWKDYPKLVEKLIEKGNVDKYIAEYVLSKEHWRNHPEWVEKFIEKGDVNGHIAESVLSQEHWRDHPELVDKLIEKGNVDIDIAYSVLSKEHWKDHPKLVEKLIEKGTIDNEIAKYVLSKEHWKKHYLEQLNGREVTVENIRAYIKDKKIKSTEINCNQHLNNIL